MRDPGNEVGCMLAGLHGERNSEWQTKDSHSTGVFEVKNVIHTRILTTLLLMLTSNLSVTLVTPENCTKKFFLRNLTFVVGSGFNM